MRILSVSASLTLVAFALGSSASSQSGPTTFSGSNTTQIVNVEQHSSGYGLKASTPSTHAVGAIYGKASASSGYTNGLWGQSYSSAGVGVRGEAKATSGAATGGAFFTDSPSGTGLLGSACLQSSNANCTGVGVHGIVNGLNTSATAGLFEISGSDGGGNLLIGRFDGSNVFRVGESGDVYADGGVYTHGADFAEAFSVRGEAKQYHPGDVLVIDADDDRRVSLSQVPYSTAVAGIYSTRPGIVAVPHTLAYNQSSSEIPMAVIGVVPTRVSTENGPIHRGDVLVTSSHSGYAMRGTDRSKLAGAILGKALQSLDSGEGVIEVLVSLH
ncbi:MAG TPA: hypothetical protein VGL89_12815 [Candidatus Koribacter sp.]|jgi:hypothetical protein